MSGVSDLLIPGSEEVISHYRLLLARAKTEKEREFNRSRIESEQRSLDGFRDGFSDRIAA
jgi:hypothetical protein